MKETVDMREVVCSLMKLRDKLGDLSDIIDDISECVDNVAVELTKEIEPMGDDDDDE